MSFKPPDIVLPPDEPITCVPPINAITRIYQMLQECICENECLLEYFDSSSYDDCPLCNEQSYGDTPCPVYVMQAPSNAPNPYINLRLVNRPSETIALVPSQLIVQIIDDGNTPFRAHEIARRITLAIGNAFFTDEECCAVNFRLGVPYGNDKPTNEDCIWVYELIFPIKYMDRAMLVDYCSDYCNPKKSPFIAPVSNMQKLMKQIEANKV